MIPLTCFKKYDIRGKISEEITPALAYAIGYCLAGDLGFKNIAIGYDARLSGPVLCENMAYGIKNAGGMPFLAGLCCTEEIYWLGQVDTYEALVMITGSHNPADENGFKIIRKGAIPVCSENGLKEIKDHVEKIPENCVQSGGLTCKMNNISGFRKSYVNWLLKYAAFGITKPLKVVLNCGNGCAGLIAAELANRLPLEIIWLNKNPDGTFPNGVPNPLLPDKRDETSKAVRESGAHFGVAWDGDADRCFFFDEKGNFIEGYYLVGLLAEQILKKCPGEKIVHDPRLYWNTQEIVCNNNGIPVKGKTGHTFMKQRMRAENAAYGGEMSSHHYFRDFAYCDSGILPFLLIANIVADSGQSLSELVAARIALFPCSGEINRKITDPERALRQVKKKFAAQVKHMDYTDGIDADCGDWRFSLRKSNTEPLVRLNVESRGNESLMRAKTRELLQVLENI